MRDKIVRRTLADGTVREYRYERGCCSPRTIGSLIREFRSAPEFAELAKATKITYERALNTIGQLDTVLITDIRRRHVLMQRDAKAGTPAIANQLVRVWSVLMNFAIDREYRADNPAFRVKKMEGGEHARWGQDAIDYALGNLPEYLRRTVVMALYTGQREADCIRMMWSDWDGHGIAVTQGKTGAKLWIPCHHALTSELTEWRKSATATTILTTSRGLPWGSGFQQKISKELRAHRQLEGCVFHGLRKEAASRLAEAGCSTLEIMAITGHRSLGMVELYSRQADQKGRASAAILKLERRKS